MSAANRPLLPPAATISNARGRIAELAQEIEAYLQADPFLLCCRKVASDARLQLYVETKMPQPPEIGTAAAAVVLELRVALDLSFQSACCGISDTSAAAKFPFASSAQTLDATISSLRFAPDGELANALRILQPYPGGTYGLNLLADLHVPAMHGYVPVGGLATTFLGREGFAFDDTGAAIESVPLFARESVRAVEKLQYKKAAQPVFTVCFTEIESVAGKPVVETLERLALSCAFAVERMASAAES